MLELGFKELLGHISLLKTKNVGLNQVQVGKSVQTKFKYLPLLMQPHKYRMYANHFGLIEKMKLHSEAFEPNAQGCAFVHPIFLPQIRKRQIQCTHF